MKKILKWTFWVILFLVTCSVLLFLNVDFKIPSFQSSQIDDLPKVKVAIVFGAMVYGNGDLSPFLKDRVDGGIKLYREGKVEKILMSGDNRTKQYNEVVAMQKYALKEGVPEDKIVLDYAGFSTYETCYRAKEIFGIKDAILVSQNYHIPRAVYTCRKIGIDAFGFGQPDWNRYPDVMPRTIFREYLAQVKMYLELYITKPPPTFLGKKEYIE